MLRASIPTQIMSTVDEVHMVKRQIIYLTKLRIATEWTRKNEYICKSWYQQNNPDKLF
jgi:hypothetical protein